MNLGDPSAAGSRVARVFDLAWQDTEQAIVELQGLDNGQLRHVAALCRTIEAEARKIRRERLIAVRPEGPS